MTRTDPAPEIGGYRDRFVTVDGLELHYTEWGAEHDEVVVCVHGFSRTGRDFDGIASHLAQEYRVLCPDVPGRGRSEWSDDPEQRYSRSALASTMAGFPEALGIDSLRWVGTSMGGAIGIQVAGGPLRDRITHLVLNDIGPGPAPGEEPSTAGRERIYDYLSQPPSFDRYSELESYYREIYGAGRSQERWRSFTLTSARRRDDGGVTPNYDPAIVDVGFAEGPRDHWAEWDAISADVLVLRGAESDVLSRATTEAMTARGPDCEVVEFPGIGHAPSLTGDEQLDLVTSFLGG